MGPTEPFDQLAADYDDWYDRPEGRFVEEIELDALRRCLESIGPSISGKRVLEVGAGTGRVARRLAEWGAEVTALEPSDAMRRFGERRTRGLSVTWTKGKGERLRWAAETFDVVLMFAALEFMHDGVMAVQQAWRALRSGGSLTIGHFMPEGSWATRYARAGARGKSPWNRATWWTRRQLSEVIGAPPDCFVEALYLAPDHAKEPLTADLEARKRAEPPSWEVVRWEKVRQHKHS